MSRSIPLILDRITSPNFPIDLVDKDLGYFELLAADLGAEVPLARSAARSSGAPSAMVSATPTSPDSPSITSDRQPALN